MRKKGRVILKEVRGIHQMLGELIRSLPNAPQCVQRKSLVELIKETVKTLYSSRGGVGSESRGLVDLERQRAELGFPWVFQRGS